MTDSKENHRTENSSVSRKDSSDDPEVIEFDQDGVPISDFKSKSKQNVPEKSTDETQISTLKKQLKDIFVQVDQEK